ncbi:acetyl/propionyl/methylcrotonyl-CoA carboxylase subunit alpha [Rothia halotolerans]|uniref:acetyl/propionyl/methylcrotonyl-CoA carboxylase subunit alpha n=1 Tax=Rothia halotolerans TaxID=405770 RepID=UPI00101B7AD2|nr:biotin carboxylase N-terminal domain-containing protein [Rothia halotolerans]
MTGFTKVLIANRGEIAVRVIRTARDEGLATVAVYADPDRGALHVEMADEAVPLGGATAAESYLAIGKILEAAHRTGADAVHPGYGFLSENAEFARAVAEAGLTWIGPPPAAIEALGDKVSARRIAERVGAPLAPGTVDPVGEAREVLDFADEHGLPVAIKAAHGGGGRGIKVARRREEIPELFDSAVREATAAFGRGECFVERFLDAPRHVETQCLADTHGTVVVVSTRDCSLQRRNQKLVEEAPAPFLTEGQERELYRASEALLREAGYVGAGTCEFLVGRDGTISFLEVNTRLQVEHPVSEEVAGLDLVAEQLRIARGERLAPGHPEIRGHSFEFRINGEDPGRDFLPSPGMITRFDLPQGPGVRVDAGVRAGDAVSGAFDSLIAKLVVTGATREQALRRSRRALGELVVEGVPTVLPFHRAVLEEAAFAPELAAGPGAAGGSEVSGAPEAPGASGAASSGGAGADLPGPGGAETEHADAAGAPGFAVHTRWIETEFARDLAPATPTAGPPEPGVVELAGRRVRLPVPPALRPAAPGAVPDADLPGSPADRLTAPVQGVVTSVLAEEGARVAAGDRLLVLEAMKMEQPVLAHRSGTLVLLRGEPGATVASGEVLAVIED